MVLLRAIARLLPLRKGVSRRLAARLTSAALARARRFHDSGCAGSASRSSIRGPCPACRSRPARRTGSSGRSHASGRSELKIPFLAAAAALLVAGCASIPSGPSVMVLPGTTKTWDQFQVDDADCRSYSSSVIGNKAAEDASGRSPQQRYDVAFQQCMYAKGHQVPMARGAVPRPRNSSAAAPPPPPPPAGAPPPPPSGYRVN